MTDVTQDRGQAEAELPAADKQGAASRPSGPGRGGLKLTGDGGLLGS